jgi:hypothetical protein
VLEEYEGGFNDYHEVGQFDDPAVSLEAWMYDHLNEANSTFYLRRDLYTIDLMKDPFS